MAPAATHAPALRPTEDKLVLQPGASASAATTCAAGGAVDSARRGGRGCVCSATGLQLRGPAAPGLEAAEQFCDPLWPGNGPACCGRRTHPAPFLATKVNAATMVAGGEQTKIRRIDVLRGAATTDGHRIVRTSARARRRHQGRRRGSANAKPASGAMSLPIELWRPMVGIRLVFSRSTRATTARGPSPLRPTEICCIRTAVIARTCSLGSGGPAVVACGATARHRARAPPPLLRSPHPRPTLPPLAGRCPSLGR